MRSLIPDQVRDRNTQRPRPAIALRDIHSLDGLRSIRAFPQCRRQLSQIEICLRREPLDRLPIHTRRAFVARTLVHASASVLGAKHLVHQAEPFATFVPEARSSTRRRRSPAPTASAVHTAASAPAIMQWASAPCAALSGIPGAVCASVVVFTSPPSCPLPRPGLCCPCLCGLRHCGPMRALSPGGLALTRQVSPLPLRCLPSIQPPTTMGLDIALSVTSAHRARPHAGELLPP